MGSQVRIMFIDSTKAKVSRPGEQTMRPAETEGVCRIFFRLGLTPPSTYADIVRESVRRAACPQPNPTQSCDPNLARQKRRHGIDITYASLSGEDVSLVGKMRYAMNQRLDSRMASSLQQPRCMLATPRKHFSDSMMSMSQQPRCQAARH